MSLTKKGTAKIPGLADNYLLTKEKPVICARARFNRCFCLTEIAYQAGHPAWHKKQDPHL